MTRLPGGTVTFMFTDIEGSTQLFARLGDAYKPLLEQHRILMRAAIAAHNGAEVGTDGDSFFVAFASVTDAVAAAVTAQLALTAHPWPSGDEVRVRMGLHTGYAEPVGDDYIAFSVHEAARVAATGHGGQVIVSDASAALVVGGLPGDVSLKDLGEHRLKDLLKPQRLFQVAHPELPAEFPPLRSLRAAQTNLPVQLTSFVGREEEVGELTKRVVDARLVTITGAGGVGKTRLASQVAATLIDEFSGGCWFVDLAVLREEDEVGRAVLRAVGVTESADENVAALRNHVREQATLIVIDNCEHLLAGVSRFVEHLLRSVPSVHVLATSREALGAPGEVAWRTPSLASPAGDSVDVENAARAPAVQLLLERVALSRPGYVLTEADVPPIVEICNRLDGIPLALELAAARMRSMTPSQVALRLDDRFRLLAGANRQLPRHETLEATIAWSVDLLSVEERELFASCGVFAGSFDLDAVMAIVGSEADLLDVSDTLTRLVDRSLVVADLENARPRYALLETTRAYSVGLLDDETKTLLEDALAEHYDAYLERTRSERSGPREREVAAEVAANDANIARAFRLSLARGDGARASRIACRWHFFLSFANRNLDSAAVLEEALRIAPPGRSTIEALVAIGDVWLELQDFAQTGEYAAEAIRLLDAEPPDGLFEQRSWANRLLALVAFWSGDVQSGLVRNQAALDAARRSDDLRVRALAMGWAANDVLRVGDTATARTLANEAGALAREVGSAWVSLQVAECQVQIAIEEGDMARALEASRERVESAARASPSNLWAAWVDFAMIAFRAHDVQTAVDALEEAAIIWATGEVVGLSRREWRSATINIYRARGEPDKAREAARAWISEARREGNARDVVTAEVAVVLVDLEEDPNCDQRAARNLLTQTIDLDLMMLQSRLRTGLARADLERGDIASFLGHIEPLFTLAFWSGEGSYEKATAAETLEFVASAAYAAGLEQAAARCLGAAEAGWPMAAGLRFLTLATQAKELRLAVRASLGEVEYIAAFDAGAAAGAHTTFADALHALRSQIASAADTVADS